jgi:hypothetical protein
VAPLCYELHSIPRSLAGHVRDRGTSVHSGISTDFPDEAFCKGIIRRPPRPFVLKRDGSHLTQLVQEHTARLGTIINMNPLRIHGDAPVESLTRPSILQRRASARTWERK